MFLSIGLSIKLNLSISFEIKKADVFDFISSKSSFSFLKFFLKLLIVLTLLIFY